MATKLDELLDILDEIIQILESNGEKRWSSWTRRSGDRLLNADYSGIEHLLSGYGGMGSFNDLVICQEYVEGEFRWKEGYVEKNNRLDELRRQAWELADHIRRNHTISN